VRSRFAARAIVVASATLVPLLVTAAPAIAKVKPDDGEVPGPSLGLGNTLLLFVVTPIVVFLVVAGLALLPSALSRPRYRPGKPWDHRPRWIGGPASWQPESAVPASESTARGGASAEW
jgi:hypothetical protein